MLTSKDILERTGISRATLNNYIAAGLIARPEVLPPRPEDGDAPRIGYFPEEVIDRIETIQRLKRDGWSLVRIAEQFARQGGDEAPPPPPSPPAVVPVPGELTGLMPAAPVSEPVPSISSAAYAPSEPRIMVIAVVAFALHDADGLWVTLPVHDYFRLAEDIESEIRGAVRRHGGEAFRSGPSRFTCHFLARPGDAHLWNALQCALAVRDAVGEVSAQWKLRRGWDLRIVMDAGLCAGETWVAASAAGDLQLMGPVTQLAQGLARWARPGCVVLTRDFVSRLPPERRELLVYAAPGPQGTPRESTFARFRELAAAQGMARALGEEPVAELLQIRGTGPVVWKDPE